MKIAADVRAGFSIFPVCYRASAAFLVDGIGPNSR